MSQESRLTRGANLETPPRLPLVCGGCGCWCDDIEWNPGQPDEFRNVCSKGRDFFNALANRLPPSTGAPDDGLIELSNALKTARRPLITGLHHSCLETQRIAAAIADFCHAVLDPFLTTASRAKTLAFQQSGEVTASWGEVKNRADLIIYWRCQPTNSPRFRERYGDLATGEFVQPNDRTVFVVDTDIDTADWETLRAHNGSDQSGSEKRPEPENRGRVHWITIGENDRLTLEELIEASVESHSNHAVRHSPSGKRQTPSWWPIHEALSQARYATIVVGHLQSGPGSDDLHSLVLIYQLMQKWAANWNSNRRCVVVPFPGTTNHCRTAQTVLTWRTGYPMSVDFSAGYPRYDVISNSWRELVKRHDVDLVVLFSGEPESPANQASWTSAYQDLERWARKNPLWEVGVTPVVPSARRFLSTLAVRNDEPERRRTIGRPDGVLLPYSAYPTPIQNREIDVIEKLWSMMQY